MDDGDEWDALLLNMERGRMAYEEEVAAHIEATKRAYMTDPQLHFRLRNMARWLERYKHMSPKDAIALALEIHAVDSMIVEQITARETP